MKDEKLEKDIEEAETDLKEEKETPSEESTEKEPTSEEEQPLKKDEEKTEEESTEEEPSSEDQVKEMLKDGTPVDKDIIVKKDKYDENADKAKLYDGFAPILKKLQDNPDILDKLTTDEDGETIEGRMDRLEQDRRDDKRKETERVLKNAITVWPQFRKSWTEVKPIADSLEKQGVSYEEAIQRAYFAINPEEAEQSGRLVEKATQIQNKEGTFSSTQGSSKVIHENKGSYELTAGDKEIARILGNDEKLYQKHADLLKALNL